MNHYLYPYGYKPSKGTNGELQCFIKLFTRLKTCSNVQNRYQKFYRNSVFMCLNQSRGIEYQSKDFFNRLNQESNIDQVIQKFQIKFLDHFDRSNILNFEFSPKKFLNLNFHFIIIIKQNSQNLKIIITTYPCICLLYNNNIKTHLSLFPLPPSLHQIHTTTQRERIILLCWKKFWIYQP